MEAERDTVLDIGLHALEDLAGDLDGGHDGRESGGQEDDIGGGLSGLGGTFDGNTAVRLLQGGGIVDTVTSHGSKMATLLKHLDDLVLVLGEDLGETIGVLTRGRRRSYQPYRCARAYPSCTPWYRERACVQVSLAMAMASPVSILTWKTEILGLSDGLGSVGAGRVEQREHTQELPVLLIFLDSNGRGSESTAGELGSLSLEEAGLLLGAVADVEHGLWSTLARKCNGRPCRCRQR